MTCSPAMRAASDALDAVVLDALRTRGPMILLDVVAAAFGEQPTRNQHLRVQTALYRLLHARSVERRFAPCNDGRHRFFWGLPGAFAAQAADSASAPPENLVPPRQLNVLALPQYVPSASMLHAARPGADDHRKYASRGYRC